MCTCSQSYRKYQSLTMPFFDDGERTQILQNSLLSQFRAIDQSWGSRGRRFANPTPPPRVCGHRSLGATAGLARLRVVGGCRPTYVGSDGECLTMTEQKLFPLLRNGLGYLKSVIEHLRVTTAIY